MLNDNMPEEEFVSFLSLAFKNAAANMKGGATFHIWFGETHRVSFEQAMSSAGMKTRQQLIWVKNNATLGRQDFQRMYESVLAGDMEPIEQESGYEPALYGWMEGGKHPWYKRRKERDVMFFDRPTASKEHPTMKPILLFDYEMKCNTKTGESVLDLFGGSGTTLMAAEQNGRTAYLMELDPAFCDVIIDRWEAFTGQKAVLLNE